MCSATVGEEDLFWVGAVVKLICTGQFGFLATGSEEGLSERESVVVVGGTGAIKYSVKFVVVACTDGLGNLGGANEGGFLSGTAVVSPARTGRFELLAGGRVRSWCPLS